MATINPTIEHRRKSVKVTWSGFATGDTVNPARGLASYALRGSIHIAGTWGGATASLLGSNNHALGYQPLREAPGGSNISMTDDDLTTIGEFCENYGVLVGGGTGDNLTAVLILMA